MIYSCTDEDVVQYCWDFRAFKSCIFGPSSCCGDKSGVRLRGTKVTTALQGFTMGNMGSRSRRGAQEGVTG